MWWIERTRGRMSFDVRALLQPLVIGMDFRVAAITTLGLDDCGYFYPRIQETGRSWKWIRALVHDVLSVCICVEHHRAMSSRPSNR